jgi:hypothetical protein
MTVHCTLSLGAICDVGLDGECGSPGLFDLGSEGDEAVAPAGDDGDGCAMLGQATCSSCADPAACASDERYGPFQLRVHCPALSVMCFSSERVPRSLSTAVEFSRER